MHAGCFSIVETEICIFCTVFWLNIQQRPHPGRARQRPQRNIGKKASDHRKLWLHSEQLAERRCGPGIRWDPGGKLFHDAQRRRQQLTLRRIAVDVDGARPGEAPGNEWTMGSNPFAWLRPKATFWTSWWILRSGKTSYVLQCTVYRDILLGLRVLAYGDRLCHLSKAMSYSMRLKCSLHESKKWLVGRNSVRAELYAEFEFRCDMGSKINIRRNRVGRLS